MSRRKPSRPTFADIVAAAPATTTAKETFSNTVPHPWITVQGQRWDLRGDGRYRGRELRRLLSHTDLPAFHEYLGKRTPIARDEREKFWQDAESLMRSSEYADFVGYEYKHPDHGRCLVVYEFC